jgi:hypothetical protein
MSKLAARALMVLTLALAGTLASAQTATVKSGVTQVKLSASLVNALTSLNVAPGTVNPTQLVDGIASFPITGGALDVKNAKGEIAHSGGLTLSKGSTIVRLQSFTIDTTGSSPVLTGIAVVNGSVVARLPLFDLQLPAHLTLPLKPAAGVRVNLNSVGVTLTDAAASTLNSIFKTSAFAGGLKIGTATASTIVSTSY